MTRWTLQDAKNKFSAVVQAALAGEPQHVTRRGKPAVVILEEAEYDRLRYLERATAPTLPELLMAIPALGDGFERLDLHARNAGS